MNKVNPRHIKAILGALKDGKCRNLSLLQGKASAIGGFSLSYANTKNCINILKTKGVVKATGTKDIELTGAATEYENQLDKATKIFNEATL